MAAGKDKKKRLQSEAAAGGGSGIHTHTLYRHHSSSLYALLLFKQFVEKKTRGEKQGWVKWVDK